MVAMSVAGAAKLPAQSPYASNADFAEHARMLREHELLKVEPQVFVPSTSANANPNATRWHRGPFSRRVPRGRRTS